MNASRSDYGAWLDRMGLSEEALNKDDLDPSRTPSSDEIAFAVLSQTPGRRVTDRLELFPLPLKKVGGLQAYRLDFFVHGLRHAGDRALRAASALEPGQSVLLILDDDNAADPLAVAVHAAGGERLGYVPRYHCSDLRALLGIGHPVQATVVRVNPSPAPVQQRVLIRLESDWPFQHPPLSGSAYRLR